MPLPASGITRRQPGHVRRSSGASARRRLITVVAGAVLLGGMLAAPVAAGVPAKPSHLLESMPRRDLSRLVGTGERVDVRAAARAALASPRVERVRTRIRPDLGAGRATRPTHVTKSLGAVRDSATAPKTTAPKTASSGGPAIAATLTPQVTTSFPGIAEADACACEPPDPWIAVSPSHVVQTTSGLVRISNRAGSMLVQMPTWALFAVPVDRIDSDPRILWDAAHSRFVGIIATFTGDFSDNGLRLAISETADPTGAWIVYTFDTGNWLPDFPGIATTGSEIVATADMFLDGASYDGPLVLMVDWSNVIAGTSLFFGGAFLEGAPIRFRAVTTLSPVANVPLLYQFNDEPWYIELTGSAQTFNFDNQVDLIMDFGISHLTIPPAPVQPGPDTIDQAADERMTDAVYRNGQLWFAATGDYFDGVDHQSMARYTRILTDTNGTVTGAVDVLGNSSGISYYTPGVGINGAGNAIVVATMSTASDYPTTVVGGVIGGSVSPYQNVEASTVAYAGERWGDYVGVAADPSGTGSVWVEHELVDSDGTWETNVIRIVSDDTAPGLPGSISQSLVYPSTLGSTVAVRTSWAAATDAGSGVTSYLVERSDGGGGFFGVETAATSITQPLILGVVSQYRVSAIDAAGNVGAPRYGPVYHPVVYQSSSGTTTTGTWHTTSSSSYSGGSSRYATSAGASMTFTATTARSIAVVVAKGATRGSFKVYVDGVLKKTVSTYASTSKYRQLVYQFNWSSAGTHKIKIVVSGTSGHPRVDIDAFVVLRT